MDAARTDNTILIKMGLDHHDRWGSGDGKDNGPEQVDRAKFADFFRSLESSFNFVFADEASPAPSKRPKGASSASRRGKPQTWFAGVRHPRCSVFNGLIAQ